MPNKQRFRIIETAQYRRDLKRIQKMGRYDLRTLDAVINFIASGEQLPAQYLNHKLHGRQYAGCKECHIQSDWLLIYRKLEDVLILQLMRTGRHTDVFGE